MTSIQHAIMVLSLERFSAIVSKIPDYDIRSTVAILTLASWTYDWVVSANTGLDTEPNVLRDQALQELMISLGDINEICQEIEEHLLGV
jgi:hypothetical protein